MFETFRKELLREYSLMGEIAPPLDTWLIQKLWECVQNDYEQCYYDDLMLAEYEKKLINEERNDQETCWYMGRLTG